MGVNVDGSYRDSCYAVIAQWFMIDQLVAHGLSIVQPQPKNAHYKKLSMRPDVPYLLVKIHDIELV